MDEVRRLQGRRIDPLLGALAAAPDGAHRFAVAFSGGMDSTALLHAMACRYDRRPLRAIHVCHHLQAQAKAWAAHCEHVCAALDIDFICIDVEVDTARQSMEAAARRARYAAFASALMADECLVLAHHVDDQAETLLLQALRGAGVAGIAAMPVIRSIGAGQAWRPWLEIARSDILAYARAQHLDWIEDPSNQDVAVDRAWLRQEIMPALAARYPAARHTLARTARWAAQAAEAVEVLAALDLDDALTGDGSLRIATLAALSPARCRACLRAWIDAADRDPPDHRHLAQIEQLLGAREHAGPRVTYADTEVRRFDHRLFVMARLSTPTHDFRYAWPRLRQSETPLQLAGDAGQLRLASADAPTVDVHIVFRTGGERLACRQGHGRALKDVLRESRTPPWVRERMPLLFCGQTLVAVADRWVHPDVEQIIGTRLAGIVWEHALIGDPGTLDSVGQR